MDLNMSVDFDVEEVLRSFYDNADIQLNEVPLTDSGVAQSLAGHHAQTTADQENNTPCLDKSSIKQVDINGRYIALK